MTRLPLCCTLLTLMAANVAADESDLESHSALPTAVSAEKIIFEFDNSTYAEIDGKRTVAVPDPEFRFPEAGTRIRGTKLKIGDRIRLSGSLLCGDDFTLRNSKNGTATLIVFWTSDCGACLAEFPVEKALYVKYKDRGLRIVSVNSDKDLQRAQETKDKFGLPWPTIYDADNGPIVRDFRVKGWPTMLLLDHNRRIIHATSVGRAGLRSRRISPPIVYSNYLVTSLAELFPAREKAAEQ